VTQVGLLPFRLRKIDLVRLETPMPTIDFGVAVHNQAVLPGRGVDPVAVIGAGRVEVEDEKVPCPFEGENIGFVVLVQETGIP
jgi:hypothetical protein